MVHFSIYLFYIVKQEKRIKHILTNTYSHVFCIKKYNLHVQTLAFYLTRTIKQVTTSLLINITCYYKSEL